MPIEEGTQAQPAPLEAVVRLPRSLTAENGAKALLIGEFHERVVSPCPDCRDENDADGCETCKGHGEVAYDIPVSWTTIKTIYRKIVEHFAT